MTRLLLPKTLQILRHLARERQVLGIEAFNLLNARASILGEVEDVDLAVAERMILMQIAVSILARHASDDCFQEES